MNHIELVNEHTNEIVENCRLRAQLRRKEKQIRIIMAVLGLVVGHALMLDWDLYHHVCVETKE